MVLVVAMLAKDGGAGVNIDVVCARWSCSRSCASGSRFTVGNSMVANADVKVDVFEKRMRNNGHQSGYVQ